ncbi:hypothetical protein GLOIN_2v1485488 [Rhizophagus clarus]|uniref:Uncharacterized protein n=1 Tax=Rhizophagus clarus TaxID=94130 RepID=A0A8H3LD01_9GLOM|nr:hypothetical protein GLOIN_2v1485488 [Rhizophagus clarus]
MDRNSDQESVSSSSSSSSSASASSSSFSSSSSAASYKTIKAKVYIWVDSELRDTYKIDEERTWVEQKENIVTKLLPPLYKLMNKKYNITNGKLLKILYGRWRSRHRVNNIKNQGEERIKQDKRRAKKNSRMQDKKKRRTKATNYLIEGKDKYIVRYPEGDLVKILKDSGYHSEEWEETDPEEDWTVIRPAVVEDGEVIEEAVKEKLTSVYIYDKWWRSSALLRLLHDRIDPTVELLRKKPPTLNPKKADNISASSVPPIGAPNWCLNQESLKQFNRSSVDIPIYDYDTDDNHDKDKEEIPNRTNSNSRKKRKTKKNPKQKRTKNHKSK